MEAGAMAAPPSSRPRRPRAPQPRGSSGSDSSPASSRSCGRRGAAGWGGGGGLALHFSSSSDDEFEMFLVRMKTPKSTTRPVSKKDDVSMKDFIDDSDDFFLDFKKRSSAPKSARKDLQTPKKSSSSGKENVCSQELLNLDVLSDDEDSVTVESLWHDCQKEGEKGLKERCIKPPSPQNQKELISRCSPDLLFGGKERNCGKENTEDKTPSFAVRQSTELESDSSDSEFESLIERIRKQSLSQKPVLSISKTVNQPSTIENRKPSYEGGQPSKGEEDKKPKSNSILLQETPSRLISSVRSSGSESGSYTPSTQTKEKCNSCSVPGCFLQDLSNPASQYVKYFKKNKEDLTQKLYHLYNNTIFERKLPEKMEIIWNKKMRKTAGYCVTGQTKSPEAQRYARIELSEKVCDSADRLRDTLIHEICHAATWLINGVRDGHGRFWRFYAKKSALIHPELPMVTRCHTYEIKYKFTYECVLCKSTIGRHSKSLDTERFVCAQCGGQLVLCQPTRKDGTPARTHLTPFAKYVKENYGSTKKEQGGLSHVEVMRKLSADFALKTRLQDSL